MGDRIAYAVFVIAILHIKIIYCVVFVYKFCVKDENGKYCQTNVVVKIPEAFMHKHA